MDAVPDILLTDLLTRLKSVQIFHGYIREVDSVYERLSNESKKSIVLAPQDSSLVDLLRKPWESLDDYAEFGVQSYEGKAGKDRADKNLQRYVKEHVVDSGFMTQDSKYENLNGNPVWYEILKDGNEKYLHPSNVHIESIHQVKNGAVWILSGPLTKP